MAGPLWHPKQRSNAQELIDWLHDQVGPRGLGSDWINDAALAELANSSTHTGLTSHTALQVLLATASSDRVEIEDFEDIFYQQHASREADLARRQAQWRFFLPLDMKLQADLPRRPRIRVLNRNFTFLRLPSVLHQLGKEDRRILQNPQLREVHTGVADEKVSQVFIAVSGSGPSWERAWDDVEPAFDALRGMIEVRSGLFGRRLFATREQAWCALSPPPWSLAKRPGLPAEWGYFKWDAHEHHRAFQYSVEDHRWLLRNTRFLRSEPTSGSTVLLIADCLRLYAQAMAARYHYQCLLGLWQLAESLTLADSFGGQTDKVVGLLAWHLEDQGLKGSGLEWTLKRIADKRNQIVHRGVREVDLQDLNMLKLACAMALLWLIRQRDSLPTEACVREFYRLRSANPKDLQAMRLCLDHMGIEPIDG